MGVHEQMSKPSFTVGETYWDRRDAYKVISIEGDRLVYEYSNGLRKEDSAEAKWRIHCNILLEQSASNPVAHPQYRAIDTGEGFFTHAEAFPIIGKAIEAHSKTHGDYMTHDDLVQAIMKDPQGQVILDRRPDKTR